MVSRIHLKARSLELIVFRKGKANAHSKDRAGGKEPPIAWSRPWINLPSCLLNDLLQEAVI